MPWCRGPKSRERLSLSWWGTWPPLFFSAGFPFFSEGNFSLCHPSGTFGTLVWSFPRILKVFFPSRSSLNRSAILSIFVSDDDTIWRSRYVGDKNFWWLCFPENFRFFSFWIKILGFSVSQTYGCKLGEKWKEKLWGWRKPPGSGSGGEGQGNLNLWADCWERIERIFIEQNG